MSTRSRLLLLATAAALFAPGPRPAVAAPKPPLCTAGRFAVQGSPLLGPGGEVVVLENRTLAVGTLCAARKAKRDPPARQVGYGEKNACRPGPARERIL